MNLCHSVSRGAESQAPPAPTGWRKRKGTCHRVMHWLWRSEFSLQQMANRPHSTHCLHPPLPHPGCRQPLWGLQKMAADIPGHTPQSGGWESCGPVPMSASRLPKNSRGKHSDPQSTAHLSFSMLSLKHDKKGPSVDQRGQTAAESHNAPSSAAVAALLCPTHSHVLSKPQLRERHPVKYQDNSSDTPFDKFCYWSCPL